MRNPLLHNFLEKVARVCVNELVFEALSRVFAETVEKFEKPLLPAPVFYNGDSVGGWEDLNSNPLEDMRATIKKIEEDAGYIRPGAMIGSGPDADYSSIAAWEAATANGTDDPVIPLAEPALLIYGGKVPTTPETPLTNQTLLAIVPLTGAGPVKGKGSVITTGYATFCRKVSDWDPAKRTTIAGVLWQGTVSKPGEGGDLQLETVSLICDSDTVHVDMTIDVVGLPAPSKKITINLPTLSKESFDAEAARAAASATERLFVRVKNAIKQVEENNAKEGIAPESKAPECDECWGSGSYKGWGKDCSRGCQKPEVTS